MKITIKNCIICFLYGYKGALHNFSEIDDSLQFVPIHQRSHVNINKNFNHEILGDIYLITDKSSKYILLVCFNNHKIFPFYKLR